MQRAVPDLESLPPGYQHLTAEMCLACKGARALCGLPCLWLKRVDERLPAMRLNSQDLFGSSPPSVFVGRYGYPQVSLGPMLAPVHLEDARAVELDAPSQWLDRRIEDVVGLRSALVRTRKPIRVKDAQRPPPLLQVTQSLALSARPIDTEVHLAKRPNLELRARVGDLLAPMGPSVEPARVRLAGQPKVAPPVERAHGDDDARAATLIGELYKAGIKTDQIEKLLSVGLLGQRAQRRIVPTRWSITATDDQVGEGLIARLRDFAPLDGGRYYDGVAHGNRFYVLLGPPPWSFDMIETWLKGAAWTLENSAFVEDHEGPEGRRSYASNVTGAYYSARLAVLELLHRLRRNACGFVYREITPDYWAPLGVWVIREGVRRVLQSTPLTFSSWSEALVHAKTRSLRTGWERQSWLIGNRLRQRRVTDY
jgi:DNA repair protein NreA